MLDASHADLYTEAGLRRLIRFLGPRGVFGLWSNDPPDPAFLRVVERVFEDVQADVVAFRNFLTGGTSSNTVYLATGSVPGGHLG